MHTRKKPNAGLQLVARDQHSYEAKKLLEKHAITPSVQGFVVQSAKVQLRREVRFYNVIISQHRFTLNSIGVALFVRYETKMTPIKVEVREKHRVKQPEQCRR